MVDAGVLFDLWKQLQMNKILAIVHAPWIAKDPPLGHEIGGIQKGAVLVRYEFADNFRRTFFRSEHEPWHVNACGMVVAFGSCNGCIGPIGFASVELLYPLLNICDGGLLLLLME